MIEKNSSIHHLPKVVLIEIKHTKEGKADRASQFLGSILRKCFALDCVLGPEKAPIAKLRKTNISSNITQTA